MGTIVVPIFLSVSCLVLWRSGRPVQMENGPMENLQVAFLLVGCVLLFTSAVRNVHPNRMLNMGLGLFYLTFIILEVDLRPYNLPTINAIWNGRVRDAWLAGLWIVAALWSMRSRIAIWESFRAWLPSAAGILLIIAGLFWLTSGAIDKLHPIRSKPLSLFVEEILEINATWLMLVSAWVSTRGCRPAQAHEVNPTHAP